MPDLDDFHAYKSTSGGSSGGASGFGCSGGFIWVFAILSFLYIIGKLAG